MANPPTRRNSSSSSSSQPTRLPAAATARGTEGNATGDRKKRKRHDDIINGFNLSLLTAKLSKEVRADLCKKKCMLMTQAIGGEAVLAVQKVKDPRGQTGDDDSIQLDDADHEGVQHMMKYDERSRKAKKGWDCIQNMEMEKDLLSIGDKRSSYHDADILMKATSSSTSFSGPDPTGNAATSHTGPDPPGNAATSFAGPDPPGNTATSFAGPDPPGQALTSFAGPDPPGQSATSFAGPDPPGQALTSFAGPDPPGQSATSYAGPDPPGNAATSFAGPDPPGQTATSYAGPDPPGQALTSFAAADSFGSAASAADPPPTATIRPSMMDMASRRIQSLNAPTSTSEGSNIAPTKTTGSPSSKSTFSTSTADNSSSLIVGSGGTIDTPYTTGITQATGNAIASTRITLIKAVFLIPAVTAVNLAIDNDITLFIASIFSSAMVVASKVRDHDKTLGIYCFHSWVYVLISMLLVLVPSKVQINDTPTEEVAIF